jgi:hypothetical protein
MHKCRGPARKHHIMSAAKMPAAAAAGAAATSSTKAHLENKSRTVSGGLRGGGTAPAAAGMATILSPSANTTSPQNSHASCCAAGDTWRTSSQLAAQVVLLAEPSAMDAHLPERRRRQMKAAPRETEHAASGGFGAAGQGFVVVKPTMTESAGCAKSGSSHVPIAGVTTLGKMDSEVGVASIDRRGKSSTPEVQTFLCRRRTKQMEVPLSTQGATSSRTVPHRRPSQAGSTSSAARSVPWHHDKGQESRDTEVTTYAYQSSPSLPPARPPYPPPCLHCCHTL